MRLLNTKTLKIEEFLGDVPEYAILSHRWEEQEVSFQDVCNDRVGGTKGWMKILRCCRLASSRGRSHVWIDTCCIDKTSSAELTEAINSMFNWYEQAVECYAFLSDVHGEVRNTSNLTMEMAKSAWFKRGWTLQELIAPSKVVFFNSRWERLWTKLTHSEELQKITQISRKLLEGRAALSEFSLAQRMSWAATRKTTRLEDEAYCLLGIFQVNMAMLYGEGKNAFRRLQEEIIKQYDDQTLFAWTDDREIKPVLAPSVSCFRDLHDLLCIYATNDSRFGHVLSNSGLNIKLMLIPWAMNIYVAPLSCGRVTAKARDPTSKTVLRGYSRMGIFLQRTKFDDHLVRTNVDGKDFIMLDSDVVAYKRDSFAIKDRQVFVRQSLVELHDEILHSFGFEYECPQLFSAGQFPTFNVDILNTSDRKINSLHIPSYIFEPYSHYESIAFRIRGTPGDEQPYYLHLGFDLDFSPVCLITTEPWLTTKADRVCEYDFEGMYSLRLTQASSLSWLLSQIRIGRTSTSLTTFKAASGRAKRIECEQLSLSIQFDLRSPEEGVLGPESAAKMWHITFKRAMSTPTDSAILATPSRVIIPPAESPVADRKPFLRRFLGGRQSKVRAPSKAYPLDSIHNSRETNTDTNTRNNTLSRTARAPGISEASHLTYVPRFSASPLEISTKEPYTSISPILHLVDPPPPIPALPANMTAKSDWNTNTYREDTAEQHHLVVAHEPIVDRVQDHKSDNKLENYYLQPNPKLDATEIDGWTALHDWASRTERDDSSFVFTADIMHYLVSEGLDIDVVDENGNTPLHVACSMHNHLAVEALLQSGAKVDTKNLCEDTPLHATLTENSFNGLEHLYFAWYLEPNEEARVLKILALLLLYGADVNTAGAYDQTALHRAVNSIVAVSLCKWLISKGASNQLVDCLDDTPLTLACYQGDVGSCVNFLWDLGIDIDKYEVQLEQARDRALNRRNWSLACNLMEHGITKNVDRALVQCVKPRNALPHSPHDEDIEHLQSQSIQLLLRNGGNPNAIAPCNCGTGDAPILYLAANRGDTEILRALLKAGANPNAPNHKNNTALTTAAEGGHIECLSALLSEPSIDVNVVDYDGDSALICAVIGGRFQAAEMLLARKDVDRSIRNKRGFTAEDLARQKSTEFTQLFADPNDLEHEQWLFREFDREVDRELQMG